jgi:hypothetical protein
MPTLVELQTRLRSAVLSHETRPLASMLVGGQRPEWRLSIHARHYRASLVRALVDRFPATTWLLGSEAVVDAARDFVASYPPSRPCIAEYGGQFPPFLATCGRVAALPYVHAFADLEFRVGQVSLEIERPWLVPGDLTGLPEQELPDVGLVLQPGLRYQRSAWAVDELMSLYLSNSAPDRFELPRVDVRLEMRGSRGAVRFSRLSAGAFAFRVAIAVGRTLGEAAEQALDAEPSFDVGSALAGIFAEQLVTAITMPETGR